MTFWQKRAARRAAEAAQLREREALVSAADWSITAAREWWPGYGEPEWSTVADVVERVREDSGLEVTTDAAAAVLRERLELRGRWGLRTDAYLGADGVDRSGPKCRHCTDVGVVLVDRARPELGYVCDLHEAMHESWAQNDGAGEGCISSVVRDSDEYQVGGGRSAFKRWMREHGR